MSKEWPLVRIGDIAEFVKRGKAPLYSEQGLVVLNQKCIRAGNILDLAPARRTDSDSRPVPDWALLRVGDTLINSTGRGTLGRACYVARLPEPATVDSHVTMVRPAVGKVEPAFLGLACSTLDAHFANLESGSTNQTELSRAAVSETLIPRPPLSVQRRIVDLMEHLDNQVESLSTQVDRLADVRSAIYRQSVADGPEAVLIDVLADVAQGKSLPKSIQGTRTGSTPWFKIADMTSADNMDGYQDAETALTQTEITDLGGRIFPRATVTFPRVGAAVLTEKKRILDVEAALDENHIALIPKGGTHPEYLLACLEHLRLSDLVRSGAVPSLNMRLIRETRVHIGKRSEQEQYGEALASTRLLRTALRRELGALTAFRASLLNALLQGTANLPDSYDELLGVAS